MTELDNLQKLMKTYDKQLKTSRNIEFMRDFYDICKSSCMPLSREETFIYRCITGIIPGFNRKTLAECLCIKEETLNKKIYMIKSILQSYFSDVQQGKRKYNKTVNSSNSDITIFDLGLSNKGLYTLRILKCYYLKDITASREETIREFLSSTDYLKVIYAMKDCGMKFDSKVYKVKNKVYKF